MVRKARRPAFEEDEVGLEADVVPAEVEQDIDTVVGFDEETGLVGLQFDDWLAQRKIKIRSLKAKAKSLYRAIQGWQDVRSEQDWMAVCEDAGVEYYSGRFLLEQLGAERYLDPKLLATLWILRNEMIEGLLDPSPAELMVIDMTVISYYNSMRVQGWIGDLALQIEREFFDDYGQNPRGRTDYRKRYGENQALIVEGQLRYLRQGLLPLLDRCNRAMIRNMRMLRELRYGPAPRVAIGKADQVNVANQQVNTKA